MSVRLSACLLLLELQVKDALSRLLDSRTASVQSGSAVTLAKLAASAKVPDTTQEKALVSSVCELLLTSAQKLKKGESGAFEVASRAVEALRCVGMLPYLVSGAHSSLSLWRVSGSVACQLLDCPNKREERDHEEAR